MPDPNPKSLPAQSLARGLRILEYIALSNRAVRLKDVANTFEMDMASTHRILKTLEEMGYVSRLSVGKSYGPGDQLRVLSESFSAVDRMVERLKPTIVDLAQATGQIAHIAILQGAHAVLAEVALSPDAKVSVRQAPGDIDELYCSAIGKSLLAFRPAHEQNALLRTITFEEFTPYTLKSLPALKRELKVVKQAGIAFDDRENDLEIACHGAPVLDKDGYAVAALGISMLARSLSGTVREEEERCKLVIQAAQKASALVQQD